MATFLHQCKLRHIDDFISLPPGLAGHADVAQYISTQNCMKNTDE